MEQPNLKSNPRMEIMALRQNAMVEGAVDSETEDYNTILQKLNLGLMTEKEALEAAHHIADKRQNYH